MILNKYFKIDVSPVTPATAGVIRILLFFLIFLLGSCSKDDPDLDSPPDSRKPMSLASDKEGATYEGVAPELSKVNVFSPDLLYPGFSYFRSPALIATNQGTLIALCQMRTGGDDDPKTLVYRRSTDNGKTWGEMYLLEELTTTKVYGNTVFVADRETGKIHLIYLESFPTDNGITCDMYHKVSSDDGVTWSDRKFIPNIVNASWRPPGPGAGIQLERGKHAGRLVVPGRYKNGNYSIYSDDGGETWALGYKSVIDNSVGPENEATCVELTALNGSESVIYINSRREQPSSTDIYRRLEAYSDDSGETLTGGFKKNTFFKTDRCQGSLFRWSAVDQGNTANRILFSTVSWAKKNGSGTAQGRRRHLGIWSTFDETESWTPVAKRINDLKAGYSGIAKTSDGYIGVLFEEGEISYFGEISFARINEAFLDVPLIGAKWDFEELSPGKTFSDGAKFADAFTGGNSRDIGSYGKFSTTAGSEVFHQNTALVFDGSSYLKLNDLDTWTQFDFNEYASFTVEVIVKTDKPGSSGLLVGRPYQNTWPQWLLKLEPEGNVSFRIDDDETFAYVKSNLSVADNLWHHVAAVRDRGSKKLKIYLDGKLSGEVADPVEGSLANRRPLFIGGSNTVENFKGEIDYVRISPVAMTDFLN